MKAIIFEVVVPNEVEKQEEILGVVNRSLQDHMKKAHPRVNALGWFVRVLSVLELKRQDI